MSLAFCPGLITSRWFVDGIGQAGFEKVKASYEQTTPLGRACTPEDVAEAVVWLVDGARTVTGELVLLDSGMHLGAKVTVPGKVRSLEKPAVAIEVIAVCAMNERARASFHSYAGAESRVEKIHNMAILYILASFYKELP